MGTRACHEHRRSCSDARDDASGDPCDMAKAGLPEAQSPVMQLFIHRKRRLKPVPRPASGYLVAGCNFRGVGRCPVRIFKGMSAAPRGALPYPRLSREEFGGVFLDLMPYLDPKGEGNSSMAANQ